ncbi:TRAF family member-associated NF-kappa-B activator isoform X5 [Equus asinus]|uniref:TRAF family member-associated NF-kappa-B activator isoform X5 n=1 Tax=Equus asinus TaxID=9793 RepID=UPI0038F647D3
MDKNIGEQLNKAYEAFRQACMDRDSAVKELQQKTENYEQRIREQQEQLSLQQTIIDKLKSQLLLVNSSRDNSYGYVPLLEDSEARKNNLTLDPPLDKVKSGIPREKESKVRRQEVSSPRKETSPRSLGIPLFHESPFGSPFLIKTVTYHRYSVARVQNCIYLEYVNSVKQFSHHPLHPGGISSGILIHTLMGRLKTHLKTDTPSSV